MTKPRKTIEVKAIVERANSLFLNSAEEMRDSRKAVQAFVADILHATGNYRGFSYLYASQMAQGKQPDAKPGIIFDDSPALNHVYPDDSRVVFYWKD